MATISFLWTIGLLWVFQSWMCSADQAGIIEKEIFVGQRVNLKCQFNSSGTIEWWYILGSYANVMIASCTCQHGQCTEPPDFLPNYYDYNFKATLHNETSVLSLTAIQDEPNIQCRIGDVVQRNFKLISVDPSDIVPNCTAVLPSSDQDGVLSVALSCGVQSGLGITFTFEGIGLDIPDTHGSSQNVITKTLQLDNFSNIPNASCVAYVPAFNITRSCNYPNIVKAQYIADKTDIIVECNTESDVDWHLFDSDGREEDIKNRSWTREGGRFLLIRDVSERDVGKVVVCQPRGCNFISNGTVIFTVISEISRDTNEASPGYFQPVPVDSSPFFVPSLLFLALWLITTIGMIGGVFMACKRSQKLSNTLVISDNEEIQTAPEYDTVIHGTSGRNDLDDDRSVSLGSLGGGSRRMMEEESKAHYMDMDGNHVSTDYQTMKSLTYENNILFEGTPHIADAADERVAGVMQVAEPGTHYIDMGGKNTQNDYEAMKSITYDNL